MITKLYNRIKTMIGEYTNKNISKNLFLSNVRTEIKEFFPSRIIKVIDTSDTRMTSNVAHIPFMFVNLEPENKEQKVSYTFLMNVDKIGKTDVLSVNLFLGAIAWQLENIEGITKTIMDELDLGTYEEVNPDYETVLNAYLKIYFDLLTHLREQYQKDFAFGIMNGTVTSPADIELLIDDINFNSLVNMDTVLKNIESKYHLPMEFIKLVKRVYDNYKRLIKKD